MPKIKITMVMEHAESKDTALVDLLTKTKEKLRRIGYTGEVQVTEMKPPAPQPEPEPALKLVEPTPEPVAVKKAAPKKKAAKKKAKRKA